MVKKRVDLSSSQTVSHYQSLPEGNHSPQICSPWNHPSNPRTIRIPTSAHVVSATGTPELPERPELPEVDALWRQVRKIHWGEWGNGHIPSWHEYWNILDIYTMDIYSILPWFYLSKIVIFHSKDRENVYHRSPEICRDAGDAASTSFHLISLLRLVVALQRQKKNTWQR